MLQRLNFHFVLENNKTEYFTVILYLTIGSVVVLFLRHFLIKFVFRPIGIWFGLKNTKFKKPLPNPTLELTFEKSENWSYCQVLELSKALDMTESQVQEWLRLKKVSNKPIVLKKFCDSFWEFSHCFFACCYGVVTLYDKPCLWNVNECWRDYNNQEYLNDIWWYFMISASFACSRTIALFYEVRRKDFHMMIVHHVTFLILLYICLRANLTLFITVVIFMSDIIDIFLESSKMSHYLNYKKLATFNFIIFCILWIIVRVGFHLWILKSFVYDVPKILTTYHTFFFYYVIIASFFVFGILTAIWSYYILKMIIGITRRSGKVVDSRSDSDD